MNDEFSLLTRYVTGSGGDEASRAHYERFAQGGFPLANRDGFSGRVAAFALRGGTSLAMTDVWTRLFDKNNVLRHKLNLVSALAECRPGFLGPNPSEIGPFDAWLGITKILAHYAGLLAVSLVFLGGLYLAFHWRRT